MLKAFESFVAAKEYEKAAHRLMSEQVPRLMGETCDDRPIFTGEIAPIVSNTAFCLELLLKCLFLVNNPGCNEKLGHNLRSIYDRLLPNVRNHVAQDYSSKIGPDTHLWVGAESDKKAFPDLVEITYDDSNDSSQAGVLSSSERHAAVRFQWTHPDPAGLSLENVLELNAQAFVEFRYSWENWEASNPASLTFDFLRVYIAIQVLKRGLLEKTPLGRHVIRYKHDGDEGTFRLSM